MIAAFAGNPINEQAQDRNMTQMLPGVLAEHKAVFGRRVPDSKWRYYMNIGRSGHCILARQAEACCLQRHAIVCFTRGSIAHNMYVPP